MQEIRVELQERSYPVQVGVGLFRDNDALTGLVEGRMVAVVTDENVARVHGAALMQAVQPHAHGVIEIVVPAGETSKDWPQLNRIFDELLANRFDRRSIIVAVGGGVVGDLAGLAAALYQRGIDFIQVPTTLLAQVDSSVGGKTAINHPAGKNMVGAFHQPRLVIADLSTLTTLPARELSAGLAEVIKHGAAFNDEYFEVVERTMPALRQLDPRAMAAAILGSVQTKARVVGLDERETGGRALLNFGHTFGHAIESGAGYGEWLHGEAVGVGMVMAAELSRQVTGLGAADVRRLESVVAAAGLPVRGPAWTGEKYRSLMSVDKKAEHGVPRFIVLESIGRARMDHAQVADVDAAIAAHVAG